MALDRGSERAGNDYGRLKMLKPEEIAILYRERDALMPTAGRRDERGVCPERVLAIENQVVLANMRFVMSIAKKYLYLGFDIEDLIQWGSIGLMMAAQKFNVNRGFQFLTYAKWWIHRQTVREALQVGGTACIPRGAHEKLSKFKRVKKDFLDEFGREPNREELLWLLKQNNLFFGGHGQKDRDFGTSLQTFLELEALSHSALSLDALIGDEDGRTLHEFVADPDGVDSTTQHAREELSEVLGEALDKLPYREGFVLRERFFDDQTLEQVGAKLGLTREPVRKAALRALAKLRANPKLGSFLD